MESTSDKANNKYGFILIRKEKESTYIDALPYENTGDLRKFVEWLHVVGYLKNDMGTPYESIVEHYQDEREDYFV